MSRTQQSSYAAGVLAPSLRSRNDLAKWQIGLAEANNLLVKTHGGISNRAGTAHVGHAKDDEFARLIPFKFSATDELFIEFTDLNMRLVQDNVISDFPANTDGWVTNACTLDDSGDYIQAPNPQHDQIRYRLTFTLDALPASGFKILASCGLVIHSNGNIYLLRAYEPTGFYRVSTSHYTNNTGNSIPLGEEVTLEVNRDGDQISVSRPGHWQFNYTTNSNYNIPSQVPGSTEDTTGLTGNYFANYALASGDCKLTVKEYSGITPADGFVFRLVPEVSDSGATDLADSGVTDNGPETTVLTDSTQAWTINEFAGFTVYNTTAGTSDLIVSNTATALTVTKDLGTSNGDSYEITEFNNAGCFRDTLDDELYFSQGEATNVYPLTVDGAVVEVPDVSSPYAEADLLEIRYAQREDVLYLTHDSYPEYALTRFLDHWEMGAVTRGAELDAPTGLTGSFNGTSPTAAFDIEYQVAALNAAGEETLVSDIETVTGHASSEWQTGKYVTLSWVPVEGADQYVVYKNSRGYFGFIGSTTGVEFRDDNIAPDSADGPKVFRDPLSGVGNYPRAVSIHQQRKTYAGSIAAPTTTYLTRTGSMTDMSVSRPLKDDDAITAQLDSNEVNSILHLVPMKDLIVVTDGGVYNMSSGANNDALSPSTTRYDLESSDGGSYVRPIVAGNTLLMVPDFRRGVREMFFQVQSGGLEGTPLEILSNHLFENDQIVDWAYQRDDSILWCVMSSGNLVTLTYLREHDVVAWTTQDTDGSFESVVVIRGDGRDVPYFTVKRTVNAATVRHIEYVTKRLPGGVLADACFLDDSISYDGSPATHFTGALHLANETCTVLADGNVVNDVEVDSLGEFDLSPAYSKVHIGRGYASDFETLDVDLATEQGTGFGHVKNVNSVVLSMENTRGIEVGPDEDNLKEFAFRTDEDYDEHTRMFTGKKDIPLTPDWNSNGRIHVRQSHPLPMTILSHIDQVEAGDD